MDEVSAGRNPVEQLVEDFLERKRRGEDPQISDYIERHPQLAGDIRELFPTLLVMEDFKPATGDLSSDDGQRTPLTRGHIPEQLGDYRIHREIGRGGMGVVYEAEQLSLGRRVALKVLPQSLASDTTALERFRREARSAGKLHHTSIVPVFEVGVDGRISYYAMQYIHGQGLDQVLRELVKLRSGEARPTASTPPALSRVTLSLCQGNFRATFGEDPAGSSERAGISGRTNGTCYVPPGVPSDTVRLGDADTADVRLPGNPDLSGVQSGCTSYYRSIAHVGYQIADALAYAHARGVVHRDIKPSNLLLDASGVVWVTDFGLAKADEDDMTHTGSIVGTLRYMAPERFHGEGDARADIYALGATLYELLTLTPAFHSGDRLQLIEQIASVAPPRPRTVDPYIPRDLETIVMKAMEKSPHNRYLSAEAMAEDLRRFLHDEPIAARQISPLEKLARWSRRHKSLAASLSTTAVLLVLLATTGWLGAAANRRLAAEKGQLADKEAELRREAQWLLYLSDMQVAYKAWEECDFTTVRELLERHLPKDGEPDCRGFEWWHLHSLLKRASAAKHVEGIGGTLKRLKSGEIASYGLSSGAGHVVSDGVRIVDPTTKQILRQYAVPRVVDMSSDGDTLLSLPGWRIPPWIHAPAADRRQLVVHDLKSGVDRQMHEFVHHVEAGALSPDGQRVAARTEDGSLFLLDAASGEVLLQRQVHAPSWGKMKYASETDTIRFSPDGSLVASGGTDNVLALWDIGSNTVRSLTGHFFMPSGARGILAIDFSSDGSRIASGGEDRTVRVWDVRTGGSIAVLAGHTGEVRTVAFRPDDNQTVISGGYDQTIRVWDVTQQHERAVLRRHYSIVYSVLFTADGREVLSTGTSGVNEAIAWKEKDWTPADMLWSEPGSPLLAAAPSMRHVVGLSPGSTRARVWSFDDHGNVERIRDLELHAPTEMGLAVSSTNRLAIALANGTVQIWDLPSMELVHSIPFEPGDASWRLAFSPDGEILAAATAGRKIWLIDADGRGEKTLLGSTPDGAKSVRFNRAADRLLVSDDSGMTSMWDVPGRRQLWEHRHGAFSTWSPDERTVAIISYASQDGESIQLREATSGALMRSFGRQRAAKGIQYLDDQTLVTIGLDGVVKLWDAGTGLLRCALPNPDSGLADLVVTADGESIATIGFSGMIRIWRAPRDEVPTLPKDTVLPDAK
jgi:eukaryotic-like serine/threonine-protein kinase